MKIVNCALLYADGDKYVWSVVTEDASEFPIDMELVADGSIWENDGTKSVLTDGEWVAESSGDSDFTTAQVTIVDSKTGSISNPYTIAAIIGDEFDSTVSYARDSSYTMEVPLYKGKQTVNVSEDIVVSGNATYDSENDIAIITGDCSLKGALLH